MYVNVDFLTFSVQNKQFTGIFKNEQNWKRRDYLANKILELENMSDIQTDITENENEFEMQITGDNYTENIKNMDRF